MDRRAINTCPRMPTIGLFPLRIVLFPGSTYPLHIFEERYKELIRECLGANAEFGINLVEDGNMYGIGCRARVSRVITEYEDGRMDILVTGTERFSVQQYHPASKPYLTADVAPFEDEQPLPDADELEATIGLYNQLIEMVYGEAEQPLDPTDWIGGGAAFRMAQKSGLDLAIRQQLLEMQSENDRMGYLRTYFQDILPRIKKAELLQSLVRNNGYAPPEK